MSIRFERHFFRDVALAALSLFLILVCSSCNTQYDKSLENDIKEDIAAKQVRILDRLLLPCFESRHKRQRKDKKKRKHKEELERGIYHILGKVDLNM